MPRKRIQKEKTMDELLNEISEPKKEPVAIYKVKVTHPSLRRRRAPNTQAEIVGLITDQGEYDIFNEVNGWGQLENGDWIMLSYTQIIY